MLTLRQAEGKPGGMRTSTSVIARHGKRVSGSLPEHIDIHKSTAWTDGSLLNLRLPVIGPCVRSLDYAAQAL